MTLKEKIQGEMEEKILQYVKQNSIFAILGKILFFLFALWLLLDYESLLFVLFAIVSFYHFLFLKIVCAWWLSVNFALWFNSILSLLDWILLQVLKLEGYFSKKSREKREEKLHELQETKWRK